MNMADLGTQELADVGRCVDLAAMGTEQLQQTDCEVRHGKLHPFADQLLRERHQRTFTQVVAAFLNDRPM